MDKLNVAIWGSTGYIGRSLIAALAQMPHVSLVAYTRNECDAVAILPQWCVERCRFATYDKPFERHDVLINAAGVGSPRVIGNDPRAVMETIETIDSYLERYLAEAPNTRVFCISSGAVRGSNATDVVSDDTPAVFRPDRFSVRDAYGVAKLTSELKHRMHAAPIIDLRVFSFFSRYVDPNDDFLLSQIAHALRSDVPFRTTAADMVRDSLTPESLLAIIWFLLDRAPENAVYDCMTAAPMRKSELLAECTRRFGLVVEIQAEPLLVNPTGEKNIYHANGSALLHLGYIPLETSLKGVCRELWAFLHLTKNKNRVG